MTELIEYAENKKLLVEAMQDKLSMWIFGYILFQGGCAREFIGESVEVSETGNLNESIGRLIKAGLISDNNRKLLPTFRGSSLARAFELTGSIPIITKNEMSIDVFLLKNFNGSQATEDVRKQIIDSFINVKRWFGGDGGRYGFADVKIAADSILYGYMAQEYLEHSVNYDKEMNRFDEWPYRFVNTLFVWPIKSDIFVLQDKRFYGAPSLDMSKTKDRVLFILQDVLKAYDVMKEPGMVFSPLQRLVTKEEMIQKLLQNDEQVTKTYIDIGKYRKDLIEQTLPVFNPREDLNSNLTEIINEYELPNVSNAYFNATKNGSLSKSKIVKAFALAGQINRITLGRGKESKEIKKTIPTHVGRVSVSDPPVEEDVINIIAFLQANLNVSFGIQRLKLGTKAAQMHLEL